ncbi:MAG: hypothetical protein ABI665_15125 [Vicinamibacterales bacterium]
MLRLFAGGAEKSCTCAGSVVLPRREYVRLKPEPIDFDAVALRIAHLMSETVEEIVNEELRRHADALDDLKAILRQVWNARGAADIDALRQSALTRQDEATLKTLDR